MRAYLQQLPISQSIFIFFFISMYVSVNRWKKRRLKQNLALNKLSRAEQELQHEREEFEKSQRLAQLERKKNEQ